VGSKKNNLKRQPRRPVDTSPEDTVPMPERVAVGIAYEFGIADPTIHRPRLQVQSDHKRFELGGELSSRDLRQVYAAFDMRFRSDNCSASSTQAQADRVRCQVPGCRRSFASTKWIGKISVRIIEIDGHTLRGWVCNDCWQAYLTATDEE